MYFARGKPPPAEPSVPLQGWKLPPETHKYRLLAQPPHATYRGRPRVARRFQTLSDLEDDHRRRSRSRSRRAAELHWHPNADEWQYVIDGEVSVTLFGSHGRYRIERLQKGDVGYIPQGYGHSIENVGSEPARILIGFNAGIYETIDLSQWIAGKSNGRARHQFRPAGGTVRKIPEPRRVHRR